MNLNVRKKLLIIRGSSQYIDIDKYNVQELGLGKILVDKNWEVTIYTSGIKSEIRRVNEHLTWIQVARKLGKYGWPNKALKFILNSQPDIIQCQDLSNIATLFPFLIRRKVKVPIVLSLGEYNPKSKLTSMFNRLMSLLIRKRTEIVLCKTMESVRYAEKLGFKNIQYAPVGIDAEHFESTAEVKEELKSKLQIIQSKSQRILCHIGRLDKEDNLKFLKSVMHFLDNRYSLILVGEPISNVSEIETNIYYLGKVPNIYVGDILNISNLYLSCSAYEPFGLSAAESIYYSCPVLGFATGGLLETVKNEYNGVLISERDPKLWASEIEKMFDTLKIAELKKGCVQSKDTMTWSSRAEKYHESYLSILPKKDLLLQSNS